MNESNVQTNSGSVVANALPPEFHNSNKNILISASIERKQKEAIEKTNISLSKFVRIAIDEKLERMK